MSVLLLAGTLGMEGRAAERERLTQGQGVPYTAPPMTMATDEWVYGLGVQNYATNDQNVLGALHLGLTVIDQHGLPQPGLAESLPTVANKGARLVSGNLVVTWHLTSGLRWGDGTPLVAAQALVWIRLQQTPEGGYPAATSSILAARATDARTLVVTYQGSFGDYLVSPPDVINDVVEARKYKIGSLESWARASYDARTWNAQVLTQPANTASAKTAAYAASTFARFSAAYQGDQQTTPDNGNWDGPYVLGSLTEGSATLLPNTYFTALPPATTVTGTVLPRPRALIVSAFARNSSDLHIAVNIQPPTPPYTLILPVDYSFALQRPGEQVDTVPALRASHIEFNQGRPALADVRVRRALALALGGMVTGSGFEPLGSVYTTTVPLLNGGLARARTLLAQAGYCSAPGQGHCTTLTVSVVSTRPFLSGYALRDAWNQLGVVTLLTRPQPTRTIVGSYESGGLLATGAYDVAWYSVTFNWSADFRSLFTPDAIPTAARHDWTRLNYAHINDPVLTHAVTLAATALDEPTRRHWLTVAQQRVADQADWLSLESSSFTVYESGKLVNFLPRAGSLFWNAYEWSVRP